MFTKSLPFTAGDVYFSVFSGMTLSTYKHVIFVVTTAKRSLILNLMLTQRLLSLWTQIFAPNVNLVSIEYFCNARRKMFTKSLPFTAGDVYFSVFSGMTLSTYKHVIFVVTTAKRSLILNLMLTQRLLSLWT